MAYEEINGIQIIGRSPWIPISKIPTKINNYHELFLGGGSVLLAVLSLQKQNKISIKNKIYAYDINDVLINVYKNIQQNKEELYKLINLYINEYDSIEGEIINRNPKSIEEVPSCFVHCFTPALLYLTTRRSSDPALVLPSRPPKVYPVT